jgi:hypothetical protein
MSNTQSPEAWRLPPFVLTKDRQPTKGDLYHTFITFGDTPFPSATNFYNYWEIGTDYEVIAWLDESLLHPAPDAGAASMDAEMIGFAEWLPVEKKRRLKECTKEEFIKLVNADTGYWLTQYRTESLKQKRL